ncbi:hypothetical protein HNR46_000285 [Haloferula luteola]|uniref:Xylose isomerase-like TIM barrel n=1 Tax=Haloferula luteola TaxID=595692 RepID=A0A840V327_9BACT|nr:hypothetical protein [Haloferula luteola]MBB5350064.1 hypothetical protein [Haloferula luteola]
MSHSIELKAPVELGFVCTQEKFVGSLVPEEDGRLPRSEGGKLRVVEATEAVLAKSPVQVTGVQIPVFSGTLESEWDQMISELQGLGLAVHLVIMMGGVDPMDPADEEAALGQLRVPLEAAKRNGVTHVSATSVELWMQQGAERKEGVAFEEAVAQLVKLHLRVYREAGLEGSCIEAFDVEFLRPGEFTTFTDVGRLWVFVKAANEALGRRFFRCLVDAAHCGDSALEIPENEALIREIAAGGGLGVMHASSKTTRGCLATDDGWSAALLAAAAQTGELRQVFVEVFHHEDAALEALRKLDPGHGVDTRDGRDYAQVVADGLGSVTRILNGFVNRGWMPSARS